MRRAKDNLKLLNLVHYTQVNVIRLCNVHHYTKLLGQRFCANRYSNAMKSLKHCYYRCAKAAYTPIRCHLERLAFFTRFRLTSTLTRFHFHLKTHTFLPIFTFRPNQYNHQKRRFSKTLFKVEVFENGGAVSLYGREKN